MSVKIMDIETCTDCLNKDCSYVDSRIKTSLYGLRTEETVCPVAVLTDGPLDKIRCGVLEDKNCIDCGLCVLSCHNKNLELADTAYGAGSFLNLSAQQYNAIACSYLNHIFEFAANTNRNKALQFDGYVSTRNGEEAFVQIDYDNDSLESVRRLIGDFLLYSPSNRKIKTGVVVLQDLPKEGSRDVFAVLDALASFPTTSTYKFYFTTFNILRFIALHNIKSADFDDLLLDISEKDYTRRLYDTLSGMVSDKIDEIKILLRN